MKKLRDDRLEFVEQVKAVHGSSFNFTVAILDLKEGDLGSGTLIQIKDHIFVATARHVIPESPSGRLQLLRDTPTSREQGILGIVRAVRFPNETVDVGVLELPSDISLDYLGKRALNVDQISTLRPCQFPQDALLEGYPAANARHCPERGLIAGCTGCACRALKEDDWSRLLPLPAEAIPPDPGVDIFLKYDSEDVYSFEPFFRAAYPPPGGFSGGGVWDLGDCRGIWSPDKARLFGIQSAWDERRNTNRYLRATQIVCWLALVATAYSELKRDLVDRFPEINTELERRSSVLRNS